MPIVTGQQILAADVAALRMTEMMSASHQAGGVGAWEDWDLSAVVPAGTTYVLVLMSMYNNTGNATNHGVRKNGSANVRYFSTTQTITESEIVAIPTEVDGSRVIEIYDGNSAVNDTFYIIGYWK